MVKNPLDGQAHRVVISGLHLTWSLTTSEISLVGSFLRPVLFSIFTNTLEEVMKSSLSNLEGGGR